MLQTYSAVLENNQIHWVDEEPAIAAENRPLTVLITIMPQEQSNGTPHKGARIAQILRRLAERNGLAEITDPVEWQRETREDRGLPGRE